MLLPAVHAVNPLGRARRLALDKYISAHYLHGSPALPERRMGAFPAAIPGADPWESMALPCCADAAPAPRSLQEVVGHLDESFSSMLLRLIDERGLQDTDVYKRANLDRRLFSKVRKADYVPSKQTALSLCIALRLSLDETLDLLGRAGLTLSPSSLTDVIIRFHIEHGIYNIGEINAALFEYNQPLLGV